MNIVWYRLINWHIDQWNGLESPGVSPQMDDQLMFDKGAKNT